MAVSELPGNPNAVWTVKTHSQGELLSKSQNMVQFNSDNSCLQRKKKRRVSGRFELSKSRFNCIMLSFVEN